MATYFKKTILILFILIGIFSCKGNKTTTHLKNKSTAIVVTGKDFSNFVKIGTKYTSETLDISKINTVPQAGENQIWDLRMYKDPNHIREKSHDNHPVPKETSFTIATFTRRHQSEFSKEFNYTEFFEVSEEGFYKLGVKVDKTVANFGNGIFLTSTGEDDPMQPKDLIFKFPMHYNDSTHYEGTLLEQYKLTLPSLGLQDAPVERKLTSNVKSEIIGWGKLILPHEAIKDTTEVLLVRNTEMIKGNYFLNGTTAPDPLLGMFNLKEGSTHKMIFYFFVSKHYGTIATIAFDIDDANGKVVFPANYAYYTIEKHN